MKRTILWILLACWVWPSFSSAQEAAEGRVRTFEWPAEVSEAAALIPVQENGRNKPLSSFAAFTLLSINGKRKFETSWGEKLGPVEWFLDCLFFPEQATQYRCLKVDDYRIIESIGLKRHSTKRADHYSLAEILPVVDELEQQARVYSDKQRQDKRSITVLEGQIINLRHRVKRLLILTSFLDFARSDFEVANLPELAVDYPELDYLNAMEILAVWETVRQRVGDSPVEPSEGLVEAGDAIEGQLASAGFLAFIPPKRANDPIYITPRNVIETVLLEGAPMAREMALVRSFSDMVVDRLDEEKLGTGIMQLQTELQTIATERGEFSKIAEEVTFYKRDWFYRGQVVFWMGFLACAMTWFFRKGSMPWKLAYRSAIGLVLTGEGLVIAGIVSRCLLKERPPITTVYEALLFIFAAMVLLSLFVELISRNTLALTMAAVLGGAGMQVGEWNVDAEKMDTIAPLMAVLDTNFWLSIHVPTITLGYAAGILAAAFGHVFLFGKLFDVMRRIAGGSSLPKSFYNSVSKFIYGILCFGALTATVGTILGGVWANDSWGRFWGWDPKENGALLLCLGFILILHARMGGYLKQFGIALASIALGNVVLFAFWGVNLLQVGFHSYGFDATKARITNLYYLVEWGMVGLGVLVLLADRVLVKTKLAK